MKALGLQTSFIYAWQIFLFTDILYPFSHRLIKITDRTLNVFFQDFGFSVHNNPDAEDLGSFA